MKGLNVRSIAFYGAVAIALIIIGYYIFNPKQDIDKNSIQAINTPTSESSQVDSSAQNNESIAEPEPIPTTNASATSTQKLQTETSANTQDSTNDAAPVSQDNWTQSSQATNSNSQETNQAKQTDTNNTQTVDTVTQAETTPDPSPKAEPTEKPIDAAITILISEVTSQAKFYPYKLDDINMEVIAVKASDDTIRTALNTCQVCFDSGKGYYVQTGEYLVCQNCGNKFHVDQVEKVKGGCNPVPVLDENKTVLEDSILISKDYLESQKEYFTNWEKQ